MSGHDDVVIRLQQRLGLHRRFELAVEHDLAPARIDLVAPLSLQRVRLVLSLRPVDREPRATRTDTFLDLIRSKVGARIAIAILELFLLFGRSTGANRLPVERRCIEIASHINQRPTLPLGQPALQPIAHRRPRHIKVVRHPNDGVRIAQLWRQRPPGLHLMAGLLEHLAQHRGSINA